MKTESQEKLSQVAPGILQLYEVGLLRDIDLFLTQSICQHFVVQNLSADQMRRLVMVTALTSRVVGQGHICLDLQLLTPDWVLSLLPDAAIISDDVGDFVISMVSDCRSFIDTPEALLEAFSRERPQPVMMVGSRVYLKRYHDYEKRLAEHLVARASAEDKDRITPELQAAISQLLDPGASQEAARAALTRKLVIISGGPGTGKTYTVARILALLAFQSETLGRTLDVRMAAPTGKAADRMDDSLREARGGLDDMPLPVCQPACTLERLLGYRSGSPYFRHDADNPLEADVVLVDEASMIDLAKMVKLLDALRPDARLILLGDMHQLASVGPGSVLGDICAAKPLDCCRFVLTKSRRFPADSSVGKVSRAINACTTQEDAEAVWQSLVGTTNETVEDAAVDKARIMLRTNVPPTLESKHQLDPGFRSTVLNGYGELLQAETIEAAFEALGRFRIVTPVRNGPYGVWMLNQLVEQVLSFKGQAKAGVESPLWDHKLDPSEDFYRGRVVMITRNDYAIGLYNGDVGIVLPDPEDGDSLKVWFDSGEQPGDNVVRYRSVSCHLLPPHETGYAMTVHKSQGSQFKTLLLTIPPVGAERLLTRELIYTALTRTEELAYLWTTKAAFVSAVTRETTRFSGIREAIEGVGEKQKAENRKQKLL